jgi:group II intron reverse transcriptase/maturase
MIFGKEQKTQPIERLQVWEAFKKVKANGGSPGVDGITIEQVSANPRKYLYPLWNRMASGNYIPKAVRQVLIPKYDGTKRPLGIPTVVDRVGQQVIKDELESIVDKQFSEHSYGYRPHKSAHQAIERCRENCLKFSWAIDLDIKGFFDNINHDLLMKAVRRFTEKKHILLYVGRWLKAPVQQTDGTLKVNEGKGTPQGGVISPVLANIFLHFAFDKWFEKLYPESEYERYADDIIVHCKDIKEALRMLEAIKLRMKDCKLELNQQKSKIVYCRRNQKRQPSFKVKYQKFDFLGYTFKPRNIKERGKVKLGFSPAISGKSQKRIGEELRKLNIHRMVHLPIQKIAEILKSKVRGWINYFGKFRLSGMRGVFRVLNFRLSRWVRNKYRRFRKRRWYWSYKWLQKVSKNFPTLFVHWEYGFHP